MPELTPDGLDVSKAEERYLRRTFRRFALPYVALLMVFAWWVSADAPAEREGEALEAVRAELAELRSSLEGLEQQLAAVGKRAGAASELAARLEAKGAGASAGELAALQRDLRRATARIAELEGRAERVPAAQRFDALSDRIARVEERLAAPASPAAAQPAGPPAAPGATAP